MMRFIMKLAPLGALGAMAFTIGKYGFGSLASLGELMICFYATCLIFVIFVLGGILKYFGFNILKLLRYIADELWVVLGTSSSESALPSLMQKLEKLGCSESVVGLVVPTGYSFNLDGTSIYLTMAAVFITQSNRSSSFTISTNRIDTCIAAYIKRCGRCYRCRIHHTCRNFTCA
jgi:aerobic C4-dicarboxylate transport protein